MTSPVGTVHQGRSGRQGLGSGGGLVIWLPLAWHTPESQTPEGTQVHISHVVCTHSLKRHAYLSGVAGSLPKPTFLKQVEDPWWAGSLGQH